MQQSFIKDGELFEKFMIYIYEGPKVRNRTAAFMRQEMKETCSEPINCTIEQLHKAFCTVLSDYIARNPSHGKCTITDIHIGGSIIGHPNWQERAFELYEPGRGIRSISICNTVFRDSEKNWSVVPKEDLIYNNFSYITEPPTLSKPYIEHL